jgi:hypothetical protein
MIAGRIEELSLKAHTSQFGVLGVKLADVRSLRSQAINWEMAKAKAKVEEARGQHPRPAALSPNK